jgi:hypothetical protein
LEYASLVPMKDCHTYNGIAAFGDAYVGDGLHG